MPLPRSVARFNRVVTNRLTRPVAKYLPAFGVIVHTGRRTHREYRTPLNVRVILGLTKVHDFVELRRRRT